MASFSSPGVGSGIDIGSLVTQLVQAESEPASLRIESGQIEAQTEISALGALKGALDAFKSSLAPLRQSSTFRGNAATSGDEGVFTASASQSAVAGTFELEVVRLAREHRLASAGVADPGAAFGTGTLSISMGAQSFDVTIAGAAGSLEGIRDAINGAAGNPGVAATIVAVDDGLGGTHSKLLLTAGGTGTDNALVVTVADDDGNDVDALGLSALAYDPEGSGATNLGVLQGAVDAQIRLGTETITRSTNRFDDAIDGLTIDLVSASEPGETTTLTVAADGVAIRSAINDLVTNYTGLRAVLDSLASYDAGTGEAGVLLGDATLRGAERAVRRELGAEVAGLGNGLSTLAGIGITSAADGTLEVDAARLTEVIESDPQALETLFATAGTGIGHRLDAALAPFTQASGTIDSRVEGLNARLDRFSDQRFTLDARTSALEARLLAQFGAMDALVANLQSTSTFLTQQFDALSGLGSRRASGG